MKLPFAFKFSVPNAGAVTTEAVSVSPFGSVSSARTPFAALTVRPMFLLVA